jgi:dihydrofolate reductase
MDTGRKANWAVGRRPVPGVAVSTSVVADIVQQRSSDMGKIVISENISLDGVAAGQRLFDWVGQVKGEAAKILLDEALGTDALLLGRRTYEFFAARWPARAGAYADRLNSMPKYVVSSTLQDPAWNNASVVNGDVASEVSTLKRKLDGDIVVYGSILLGRTLMQHDLVDELRLMVYPVVLGAGERLFGSTSDKKPLRLVSSRTIDDGLTFFAYQPVLAA